MSKQYNRKINKWMNAQISEFLSTLSNRQVTLYKCTSKENTSSYTQSINLANSLPLYQFISFDIAGYFSLRNCRPFTRS